MTASAAMPSASDAAPKGTPRRRRPLRAWAGPAVLVGAGLSGLLGAVQMGIGTGEQVGPGMWPAIVSVVAVACGLIMGPQAETESIHKREAGQVFTAVVLLGLFIVLFSLTGIFFPVLIALTLWLKFLSGRKWVFSLIVAASTAAAFYLVFTQVFGVGA